MYYRKTLIWVSFLSLVVAAGCGGGGSTYSPGTVTGGSGGGGGGTQGGTLLQPDFEFAAGFNSAVVKGDATSRLNNETVVVTGSALPGAAVRVGMALTALYGFTGTVTLVPATDGSFSFGSPTVLPTPAGTPFGTTINCPTAFDDFALPSPVTDASVAFRVQVAGTSGDLRRRIYLVVPISRFTLRSDTLTYNFTGGRVETRSGNALLTSANGFSGTVGLSINRSPAFGQPLPASITVTLGQPTANVSPGVPATIPITIQTANPVAGNYGFDIVGQSGAYQVKSSVSVFVFASQQG